jgi:decaprenylphospho-beta-D-ribofuranose 2-oxidase
MLSPGHDSLPSFMSWQDVPAFVGSRRTRSLVAYPESEKQCVEALEYCRENGLTACPRGSGRSYGDAILNDGQMLLDMTRMNRIEKFDAEIATVTVQAGVKIVDIFARYHHLGYTLPASPTDSTISVGGALAANVNGKESWRLGNFGDQVLQIRMLTAAGDTVTLDRDNHRELFLAVLGGMGLLGLVLEVTLQLIRIPSPYLMVSIHPAENLDAMIRQLDELSQTADFIVGWIDGYASGKNLGRSVIHVTNWVESDNDAETLQRDVAGGVELLATQKHKALAFYKVAKPIINLGFHLQQIPFYLFNRFYYWLCSRGEGSPAVTGPELFLEHNFDKSYVIPPPDILCGPHGFTVQISIPREQGREGMREMLQLCRSVPCPPATTILRLHRKDECLLSFSEDGYSLNVEFHPKKRHRKKMQKFLDDLMDCGIRYGSKVHLPKDCTMSAVQFRQLFPNYQQFLDIKSEIDPQCLFCSDMYRRLFAAEGERSG